MSKPTAFRAALLQESSHLNEKEKDGDQPVFSYFESSATPAAPFKNNETSLWILLFGFDTTNLASNNSVQVRNSVGQVISAARVLQVTAAGIAYQIPVKFLIPPGGSFNVTTAGPTFFQALKGKFEEIIRFL